MQFYIAFLLLFLQMPLAYCKDGYMCSDNYHQCAHQNNTCCAKPSGAYWCCPTPNGICCADRLHCCYEGTFCDFSDGLQCVDSQGLRFAEKPLLFSKKIPALPLLPGETSNKDFEPRKLAESNVTLL
uniref:Granulins domain-containing protein n=1 Tax=Panagrolaimus sp. PS1159 TaxID=55785 RepID=A0AC35EUM3_9BILA